MIVPASLAESDIEILEENKTTAQYNESNPFALRVEMPGKKTSYILIHQSKSLDWRARDAKAHPMKQVPDDIVMLACKALNQIIDIGA